MSYGVTGGKTSNNWSIGIYHRQYAILGSMIRFAESDRAKLRAVLVFSDDLADLVDSIDSYVRLMEDNQATLDEAWQSGGHASLVEQIELLQQNGILEAELEKVIAQIDAFETLYSVADQPVETVIDLTRLPKLVESLQSSLELQGALVVESGVSFSRALPGREATRLGLTVKQLHFETIDYLALLNQSDREDFDRSDHSRDYTDANLDLGLAHRIGLHWELGLSLKNLIEQDYRTARNNRIRLRPLVRTGIAYQLKKITLAADLDITRNDPLGFDPDKRYLALGVELRRWEHSALRAGVRQNLVDNTSLYSLGMGLGYHHGHVDIAIAGRGDALGFALQGGVHF